MLDTLALILFIVWLLGFISGYTLGGSLHFFLAAAVILALAQFILRKRKFETEKDHEKK